MLNDYIEKKTCFNCIYWDVNDFEESVCTFTNEPSNDCMCEHYKCIFKDQDDEE